MYHWCAGDIGGIMGCPESTTGSAGSTACGSASCGCAGDVVVVEVVEVIVVLYQPFWSV